MRILRVALGTLAVVAVLLVAVAFVLPRQVHVERSTTIDAPAATVYALVSGFRSLHEWSPWFDEDARAHYAYEGPAWGVGAKMRWSSEDVGQGSQEIVEVAPNERVRTRLAFGDERQAMAEFRLTPASGGTLVRWSLDIDMGRNPIARYVGLLLDARIGPDYERGLAGLKRVAEALPKADFAGLEVVEVEVEPLLIAYASGGASRDPAEAGAALDAAFGQVRRFLAARRLAQAAPPIRITTRRDDSGFGFEAAIPIDRTPQKAVPESSPVQIGRTHGGKVLRTVHRGAYAGMPATYDRLLAYAAAYGHTVDGNPWDQYVTDSATTAEADLLTHMYVPIH